MEATEIRKLAEIEDKHWWYAERRHLLEASVRDLPVGRALDVGAAGGGNTRVLRRLGWDAVALEYGEEGAQVARQRNIPVVRADATYLPFADGSFDLVVAFDVLEHIVEDHTCAEEILRVLRPGGTFLVAVPCDPRLWSAHDEAVSHVRRYTRPELETLLDRAGFVIESLTSWNVLMRPIVVVRRKRITGSDQVQPHPVVNFGLRTVITAERYLPVRNLPGVSLLATVRRPAGPR